jgi:beta-lactamase class A/glucose/arabinose dehydrogenase
MNRKRFIMALAVVFVAVSVFYLVARRTEAESITAVTLPPGYRIERYIEGLTFPTGVTWDDKGTMYVAEAVVDGSVNPGFGETGQDGAGRGGAGRGRIIRVTPDAHEVVFEDLYSPVTDVKIKDGLMYVAHRGLLSVIKDGGRVDLLKGLPSGDHFTGEITFGPGGWVYVGNGTVTNSGVVGEDNFNREWAATNPGQHDVPARDIVLAGMNFTSSNPKTKSPFDNAVTGGFLPFGTESTPGQTIQGKTEAGGVIYRVREDGTEPQVYAWGFRYPLGIGFAPDGQLIAIDQGYQDRGSRPVANAPDPVYCVRKDVWYGWPDFVGGEPINDPKFLSSSKNVPLANLMQSHPQPEKPIALFETGTGAMKFAFAPVVFDKSQRMYVAAFGQGDIASAEFGSKGFQHGISSITTSKSSTHPGSCVLALDTSTGKHEVFASNKSLAPAGTNLSGFNHPVDVKFGPDGSMYVVDFGVIESNGKTYKTVSGTGSIWKISIQRSELKIFREKSMAVVKGAASAGDPDGKSSSWDPDYAGIQKSVQDYISGLASLGQEWGVFFKDLTSGKTFGVNEDLQVPAASTVKVAVVLYTSNLVSRGELSWNERLTYYADRDWRGGAGTLQYTAKDGDTFTIRELAEKAITHSDNVAWKMLEARLGKQNLINFMKEIGGQTVYPGGQNISTPRDNATYMEAALNFSKSNPEGEKLMFDLAHTIWNTGLNRYITEVQVAHKEGDIMGVADDVGVVYADKPYIVSIMSKGHDDVEAGFERIGEISRMIFDYQNGLPR